MTEANRSKNFATELERAEEALRSSRLLLAHDFYADSISRAYYAMLHAARALLFLEGLEARTHRGVGHQLNLHLVREGRFDPDLARAFSRYQADREAADYDGSAVFNQTQAEEVVLAATRFIEVVQNSKPIDEASP